MAVRVRIVWFRLAVESSRGTFRQVRSGCDVVRLGSLVWS